MKSAAGAPAAVFLAVGERVRMMRAALLCLAMASTRADAQTAVPDAPPPPGPSANAGMVESAEPVRILVIDIDTLRSAGLAGTPDMDAAFKEFAAALSSSRGATLILDRKAVVVGSPGFDVTALAETSMENFRKTGTLPPLEPGPLAPIARLEVLDRAALLRTSAVGRDIQAQVRALTHSAESELRPQSLAMRTEGELLQWQMSTLPADEGAHDKEDFDERRDAFRQEVKEHQDQIRAAVEVAQKQVEAVAGPIVQQIMVYDDANILVDRMAVVIGAPHFDITTLAIAKLDAALSHVDLVLPPEETKQ